MITFKCTCFKNRIKKNGAVALYIRVTFSGYSSRYIPLEFTWPYKRFDYENGRCLARSKDDKEVNANNTLIRNELAKLNDIVVDYRLSKRQLTIQLLFNEYYEVASKTDFIRYYMQKLKYRHKRREITWETYEANLKVIRKLRQWKKNIPFEDFHENWAQEFTDYLKDIIQTRIQNPANTIWNHHKQVKAYLNLARRDGYRFADPYQNYKLKAVKGTWKPLWQDDVKKIYHYYKEATDVYERRALRRFLWACGTSMRVSDINRVTRDWMKGDYIVYNPYKGRDLTKMIELPVNKLVKELWRDALRESVGELYLFRGISDQKSNEIVKKVTKLLGITEKAHHHIGRHTFISLYVAKTNDLRGAQEFAGHWSIKQTETYTHYSRIHGKQNMRKMDDLAG